MTAKSDQKADLVDLIGSAGEAELTKIEARIEAIGREIHDFTGSRQRELGALRIVRQAIKYRLQGRGPGRRSKPRPAKAQAASAADPPLANLIYDLLSIEGPMPVPAIAARLGRAAAGVGKCVSSSSWFLRTNGEVQIAMKGGSHDRLDT